MALPNNQAGAQAGRIQYKSATFWQTVAQKAARPQWLGFNDEVDSWGIYSFAGTPNGNIAADIGSICTDTTNGIIYKKTTDTVNTGWVDVSSSGSSITVTGQAALTAPAVTATLAGSNYAIEDRTWQTQYVVDPSATPGLRGTYTSIQAAVNQIELDRVSDPSMTCGYIYLRPKASRTESVTFSDFFYIVKTEYSPFQNSPQSMRLVGLQTLNGSGTVIFENLSLLNGVSSPVSGPGSATVILRNSLVNSYSASVNLYAYESTFQGTTFTTAVNYLENCTFNSTCTLSGGAQIIAKNCKGPGNGTGGGPLLVLNGTSFAYLENCYDILVEGNTTGGVRLLNCSLTASVNLPNATNVSYSMVTNDRSDAGTGIQNSLFVVDPLTILPTTQGNVVTPRIVTASGIINNNYQYVSCEQTTAINIGLATTGGNVFLKGQKVYIYDKLGTAATNPITISPQTGTINGAASIILNQNYGQITAVCDGTNFHAIIEYGSASSAAGDVVGPASSFGDTIAIFDGATGKLIKDPGLSYINPVFSGAVQAGGNFNGGANLTLPATNAGGTAGVISIGGSAFLHNAVDPSNIFIGPLAGNFSTLTGGNNTVAGYAAGNGMGAANRNAYWGKSAGQNGLDVNDNVAIGFNCMSSGTAFNNNVGVGRTALELCNSDDNVAVGLSALNALTSGAGGNTAIGSLVLGLLDTGTNVIAIGIAAGFDCSSSESDSIFIGNRGGAGLSNTTRIGTDGTHNTFYAAGINGATVTGAAVLCAADGQLGTVVSSRRFKDDIEDVQESILALRPVKFRYKDTEKSSFGLIAEEVAENFPALCIKDKDGSPYSVNYHEMPALLLKEIQRLEARITALESR